MPRSWLILPLLVLYLLNLGAVGFVGPDEPRYASIGREMAHSGDWITPRLNGVPWFEKPPLLYWMTAAATRAGLSDEWAARLPVVLASAAFLAFFFSILQREFSARTAGIATAILGTSAGWLVSSFAAITDLPMSAALGAAMLMVLSGRQPHGMLRGMRGLAAGALMGVAILGKAFVPVVLFAPVWLIARGHRLAVLAGAAVVAGPWFLLCWMRNGPVFWNDFFWKQQVERMVSPTFHPQPVWYYVPILLAGLFPWTPLVALLARRTTYRDARIRFLAGWLAFALIFFSAARNGLPAYVLPMLPPLAIVLALALEKVSGQEWWLAACVLLLVLLPSIAAALPEALAGSVRTAHWSFHPGGLLFVAAAAGVWWLARRGRMQEAVLAGALAVVAGAAFIKVRTFPVLDQQVSARAFWVAHRDELNMACLDWSVPAPWEYGLNYYAGRALPRCQDGESRSRVVERNGAVAIRQP